MTVKYEHTIIHGLKPQQSFFDYPTSRNDLKIDECMRKCLTGVI